MAYDAVTLTSKQYCSKCGSFDLVKRNGSSLLAHLSREPAAYHCFGCNRKISIHSIEQNRLKVIPTHPDAYFLPPKCHQTVQPSKPLRPVTALAGISIITASVYGLIVYSPDVNYRSQAVAELEWTNPESLVVKQNEREVLEALKTEFNEIMNDKKNPVR